MVTKRRKPASKSALRAKVSDFVLRDIRTVSINCERFLNPSEVTKGGYRMKVESVLNFPEREKGEKGPIVVSYFLSAQGHKANEEDGKTVLGPRSFSVEMKTEAIFALRNGEHGVSSTSLSKELIHGLLAQINPLLMLRLRSFAADMGFRGFRPDLGIVESDDLKATGASSPALLR